MGNSFGTLFKITTFGESHGPAIGVIVDGCPSQLPISTEEIQQELNRRRPGQSRITTPRDEADAVRILSGIQNGLTLGTPIAMMVENKDQNSKAYDHLKSVFRPSHADYTYQEKFGIRSWAGGGRASARETIGRVAAGAIAKKILHHYFGISILSYVSQIHSLSATIDPNGVTHESIDSNPVRCPDTQILEEMIAAIENARKEGDSLGGCIRGLAKGVPVGWGEPVFDKLKADLAKAMMSIPATMGFQIGSGFSSASMKGSQHNDAFFIQEDRVHTRSNYSGGIQGGISNGETIYFDVAFKPTATIFKSQDTITTDHHPITLQAKGRHDPCVLPRAVPIVDAMTALVLVDHALRQRARSF